MPNSNLMGANSETYANIFTYMGLPLSRDLDNNVDAVVMGVPYDLATSGRPGTRFGPTGIRQASAQLRWEKKRWPYIFELAEKLRVIDYGDIEFDLGKHEQMVSEVEDNAGKIIAAGKILLTLGGDHYITLPLLRAAAKTHGKMALIHFDAHTDTETGFDGHYHGSMFYHAPKENLIDSDKTIQIGIRTEIENETGIHPFKVLDAVWANNQSVDEIVQAIKERVGDAPAYLSLDIDCLDPAYAPGTGTPVSGGLTSNKTMQILRGLK
ncbi:MAG: agmatinase, partial [Gammaproteobacteria bacterium]|nr:agmatinase [Gammaproteobacteria bacterium]